MPKKNTLFSSILITIIGNNFTDIGNIAHKWEEYQECCFYLMKQPENKIYTAINVFAEAMNRGFDKFHNVWAH